MSRAARALLRSTAAALPILLAGCSSLPGPTPAASAESAPRAAYRLEIEAPDTLRPILATHLDLARFQLAPQTESITASELDRLAAAAPAQARTLLETEGYFDATVRVARATADDGLPLVVLVVDPGPRVQVRRVSIEAAGDLGDAAEAKDADALALIARIRERWPLQPGEPFRLLWRDPLMLVFALGWIATLLWLFHG